MRTFTDICSILEILGIAFNSLIIVRDQGLNVFAYLILIPIMTDTFAFMLGIKFGKHKMCPKISPHKSWEGAIAGLIFGTIIPCFFFAICAQKYKKLFKKQHMTRKSVPLLAKI